MQKLGPNRLYKNWEGLRAKANATRLVWKVALPSQAWNKSHNISGASAGKKPTSTLTHKKESPHFNNFWYPLTAPLPPRAVAYNQEKKVIIRTYYELIKVDFSLCEVSYPCLEDAFKDFELPLSLPALQLVRWWYAQLVSGPRISISTRCSVPPNNGQTRRWLRVQP